MRFFLTATIALVAFLALTETAGAEWVWPLRGQVITTYRNVDDPYAGGQHRGIDIGGPVGARVVAAAGGEVRFAGTAGASGLTLSVRTPDGFDTSYLHLSSFSVREGELVSPGDALGAVGLTGSRSASEPHLHFGVREAGTRHAYRNPLDFLPPPEVPPAPDSPHAAPSPAPVPTPFAPAPAPAGEPGRVPAGDGAPHRVPAYGGAPAAEPAPAPTPTLEPLPRHVPVDQDAPRRLRLGEHAPRRVVPDGRASRAAPEPLSLGPTPGPAPAETAASRESPGAEGRPVNPPENAAPGPDIGWILACVGLLLAAGLLGLTEDGRKASRKGGGHLARLLRPLTGRG